MQCSVHCARHVAFYEAEYLQAATAATTSDGHCSNSDTIDSHCNEHDPDCSNNSDPLCSNSSDSSDLSPMNAEEEWGYTSGFWLDRCRLHVFALVRSCCCCVLLGEGEEATLLFSGLNFWQVGVSCQGIQESVRSMLCESIVAW